MKFKIAALMGTVLVAAVGFAALRAPTVWWASGPFTLGFAVLG